MLKIATKSLKKYEFIDLFCGIGGFHLALSSFGAKCVFASEINERACDVYEKNFKMRPCGDITKIVASDIPRHDILCAGFPCQPFSISGNKAGLNDKNGKLFFEIIRIATHHRPKIIFLENVKNLVNHDSQKTLKTIVRELKKINYDVFYDVLNASDFGVPQARKRLYIVCFRNDLKVNSFEFPLKHKKTTILNDILLDSNDEELFVHQEHKIDENYNYKANKSRNLVRIGSTGLGRQGERIYSPLGQAVTLSSQGGGPAGKTGMYFINNRVRRLHKRECARVMGFPETFILPESTGECYRQFGNSVVVNVLQKIVKNIVLTLKEE